MRDSFLASAGIQETMRKPAPCWFVLFVQGQCSLAIANGLRKLLLGEGEFGQVSPTAGIFLHKLHCRQIGA